MGAHTINATRRPDVLVRVFTKCTCIAHVIRTTLPLQPLYVVGKYSYQTGCELNVGCEIVGGNQQDEEHISKQTTTHTKTNNQERNQRQKTQMQQHDAHTPMCMHAYTCTCTHIYMYVHMYMSNVHTHTQTHACKREQGRNALGGGVWRKPNYTDKRRNEQMNKEADNKEHGHIHVT